MRLLWINLYHLWCGNRLRTWLFKTLFRIEYDHMGELVDDVIRLELDKKKANYTVQIISGTDNANLIFFTEASI
uniref:Uncharacterized protein n=1 Tax=viral metagenome TaxID=1070528 RepID=A0A6M3KM85_9ZZZZ